MRYKSFQIRNFKGIKDTTVSLDNLVGAGVFAFVGLNESGKTTVLEAIHSFSPESSTSQLLGGEEGVGVPFKERVPRHSISTFTGDVSVKATIAVTDDDKQTITSKFFKNTELEIDLATFPDELVLERQQRFENGDFKDTFFTLRTPLKVKTRKQRRWREPTTEESKQLRNTIHNSAPDIAYFPTFVFNFPERVFLTSRGGIVDQFYRRVFQDILDYDGQGLSILKDVVHRVRGEGLVVPWANFLATWGLHDDRAKIQHVMDRAGAALTKLIFGSWNKIFGEDTKGKEIVVTYEILEGETEENPGVVTKTQKHDVYIQFQIRDGTRRFNVNDRSLGFRWFFAFMLFTQFRVARSSSRPMLFLFDEPASNLHAAAQQRLSESFPEIARGDHMLAYSTHSHYMIEPKWLEQTFIVTNRADAPENSILDGVSLDDESLDIKVSTYRSFVDAHPNQTSYFQPILDRLAVVPSRFDMQRASIILEGKSDYYVLRYLVGLTKSAEISLLPALGAGTFGALAALHVGWNLNFLFVLDGDKQGKAEKSRYSSDFGIPLSRITTIDELVSGINVIEDLLDTKALDFIARKLKQTTPPTKSQIRRFFQESLAGSTFDKLSDDFLKNGRKLLQEMKSRLH